MADLLGERPARSEQVPWGFDALSQVVTLTSGRPVVLQARAVGPDGGDALHVGSAIGVLRAAGICVPTLLGAVVVGDRELQVFAVVEGVPGPELIGDPQRGPALADSMGRIVRSLAACPCDELAVDQAWVDPATLQQGCREWQAALGEDALPSGASLALDRVTGRSWRVTASHGDFVPANVLVADDGSVTLLDLGGVAASHPLLDVAWWTLIVRHHHADLASRLVPRLLAAAGLERMAPGDGLLSAVAVLRALQLAARQAPGDRRRHHLRLVATAASWSAHTAADG